MNHNIMIAVAALLLLASPGEAGEPAKSKAKPPAAPAPRAAAVDSMKLASLREGWPDTRAGQLGFGWVDAFSTSEEALRSFKAEYLAEKPPAERGAKVRVENYRKLRERYGTLTLGAVERSTPGELEVTLLSTDASVHRFVFKVQTEAPFKLLSVSIVERGFGHGGFHH